MEDSVSHLQIMSQRPHNVNHKKICNVITELSYLRASRLAWGRHPKSESLSMQFSKYFAFDGSFPLLGLGRLVQIGL
ncbi:MAG: hypothetical protein ACK5PU_03030, partial [bacterium]